MKNKIVCLVLLFSISTSAAPVDSTAANSFRRALPGYTFEFPRDYFDHPEFRTEWWYYTGNLKDQKGRRFGYELTFFRHAVDRTQRTDPNVWDVSDVWLAHFALSDIDGGEFYHSERLNRSGKGLAGASRQSGLVWNGNWRVQWNLEPGRHPRKALFAVAPGFAVDLKLASEKPPVVHGRNGVSQKSEGAGRASHYVSLTRLKTAGKLRIGDREFVVEGLSWMDHEFFTHSLESNQSGWDWFSLQFEDGSELMLYRLRLKDGTVEPLSSGTYISPDGRTQHLALNQFTLSPIPGQTWTSPNTRGVYPLAWRFAVPSLGIEGTTRTRLPKQELLSKRAASPSYWEGAIDIEATASGKPLRGSGYLEMTGYSGTVRMGD